MTELKSDTLDIFSNLLSSLTPTDNLSGDKWTGRYQSYVGSSPSQLTCPLRNSTPMPVGNHIQEPKAVYHSHT